MTVAELSKEEFKTISSRSHAPIIYQAWECIIYAPRAFSFDSEVCILSSLHAIKITMTFLEKENYDTYSRNQ